MSKVTCFGEIMLRLSPPDNQRLIQTRTLDMNFGGSEANVAVSLSQLGTQASYISKVPDNPLGDACINTLRGLGVDTNGMVKGGSRLGIYFLEHGASLRASRVVYDRKESSFALASYDDFDWDDILDSTDWLHLSGITPALSLNAASVLERIIGDASSRKISISFDTNYRSSLWSISDASVTISKLIEGVDVLVCGESDLSTIFNIVRTSSEDSAMELLERYSLRQVAVTKREVLSASRNRYHAFMVDSSSDSIYRSPTYEFDIVDRVGSGDAFTAGLIHGLVKSLPFQTTIDFATVNSVIKNTIPGDFSLTSEDEVFSLMNSKNPGTIVR